jgi:hypothetical protein
MTSLEGGWEVMTFIEVSHLLTGMLGKVCGSNLKFFTEN